MEIDLHNKNSKEAMDFFIDKYNEVIKSNENEHLYVIHGYGSSGKGGKIKRVLHKYLKRHKEFLDYEFDSNPGAIIIYPKKALPNKLSAIEDEILEFCKENPKSLSKIESKFFKQLNSNELKKLVNSLVKKDLLYKFNKKSVIVFYTKNKKRP